VALVVGGLGACATAGGGSHTDGEALAVAQAAHSAPLRPLAMTPQEFLRNAQGIYVLVDLDENRLRLMDGHDVLWEAIVGTGTGLRLKGPDGHWQFSTPQGVFPVLYKEEMPVWIAPDWFYVEKNLPIPPENDPSRRYPGDLGIAAVYIGQDLAIHGTERPELLGHRVSHGCIRLANKYAQRLFHDVQIGTPVVIIGGKDLANEKPLKTTDSGKPGVTVKDTLGVYTTPQLLARLDSALAHPDTMALWVPLASRLITRGIKDDAPALRGLLERAGTAATDDLNREYSAFLADAYSRASLRTVVSLARIDEAARDRAAHAIVSATLALHPFGQVDPSTPWPTRRVPPGRLGPDGRKGWDALASAEKVVQSSDDGSLANARARAAR
jgi:hypothetical protein